VQYYYVDPTLGGLDWQAAFREALEASRASESPAQTQRITAALLAKLQDPYTRILPKASAARRFQAESSGKVRHRTHPHTLLLMMAIQPCGRVQVLTYGLSAEVDAGRCRVAFVAPGGSAEAAGVAAGDTIEAFRGRPVDADACGCVTVASSVSSAQLGGHSPSRLLQAAQDGSAEPRD